MGILSSIIGNVAGSQAEPRLRKVHEALSDLNGVLKEGVATFDGDMDAKTKKEVVAAIKGLRPHLKAIDGHLAQVAEELQAARKGDGALSLAMRGVDGLVGGLVGDIDQLREYVQKTMGEVK